MGKYWSMLGETTEEERNVIENLKQDFYNVAIFQGSSSQIIMSLYFYHPDIARKLGYDPTNILYINMCYGTSVFIFSRPAMQKIRPFYRIMYSTLGSLMFNYSCIAVLQWIDNKVDVDVYWKTALGYASGRIFTFILYSYLYFVDTTNNHLSRHPSWMDVILNHVDGEINS